MRFDQGKSPSKSESKIEADEIAKHVESFSAMGLEQDAVIEALHLIGPSRLDRVTEFLFSAPERQDAVRHTEFERKLRLLDEGGSHLLLSRSPSVMFAAHKKEMDEMSNEFESKKRTLIATAYGHFLRTSLCDGLVSEETVERLREMQSSARFSQSQHTKALQDIGLSVQAVEDMQELGQFVPRACLSCC